MKLLFTWFWDLEVLELHSFKVRFIANNKYLWIFVYLENVLDFLSCHLEQASQSEYFISLIESFRRLLQYVTDSRIKQIDLKLCHFLLVLSRFCKYLVHIDNAILSEEIGDI